MYNLFGAIGLSTLGFSNGLSKRIRNGFNSSFRPDSLC